MTFDRRWIRCAAVLAFAALAGCAAQSVRAPDPLIERIFESESGREIARDALFDRMGDADVVYLAELHDHPDHHRHQREVMEALIARGRKPAVGFELFSREETSTLMNFAGPSQHHTADMDAALADLRERLGWGARDDAYWAFYRPIFAVIRENHLVVFGADLPAALRARMAMVEEGALSGVERRQVPASDLVDENYRQLMYAEFREGHCGFGPESYVSKLYAVWLARNESMADAIVTTLEHGDGPVVFLTGSAHTRYGMGVLERVAHRRPGTAQMDIGFTVVEPGPEPIEHYAEHTKLETRDYGPDHEYLWMTARYKPLEPDPCAPFRKRTSAGSGS